MNYIISISPLSNEYKTQLIKQLNMEFDYLTLAELRRKKIKNLISFIRKLNADNLIIALEDIESRALLPVIKAFCLFVRAKNKFFIDKDSKLERLSVSRANASFLKLALTSIILQFYKYKSWLELKFTRHKQTTSLKLDAIDNILYINANLWFGVKAGGSVGHVAGVVNGFQQKSCKVEYCAVSPNVLLKTNNYVKLQPLKSFGFPDELNLYRFSAQAYHQLHQHIKKNKINFIYQRLSQCNYTGVKLAKKNNIPLILEYNGSEVWCSEKWGRGLKYPRLALLAEQVCLQSAYRVITISKVLKEELINRGVPEDKIVCYPNCFDPIIFNPARFTQEILIQARQQYGLDIKDLVFTFVGTFGKWHGVEILARTIVNLVKNHEEFLKKNRIKFLLIGDGSQMEIVKTILNHAPYKPYFLLPGLIPQEQTPLHLALSDVLLSPHVPNADGSRFFGSPTKLFEYMAMGKPIIASDLEQIGEVLDDSIHIKKNIPAYSERLTKTALLCRPGNIEDLENAIVFLANNVEWRNLLGMNVQKLALSKYTWGEHVSQIIKKLQ